MSSRLAHFVQGAACFPTALLPTRVPPRVFLLFAIIAEFLPGFLPSGATGRRSGARPPSVPQNGNAFSAIEMETISSAREEVLCARMDVHADRRAVGSASSSQNREQLSSLRREYETSTTAALSRGSAADRRTAANATLQSVPIIVDGYVLLVQGAYDQTKRDCDAKLPTYTAMLDQIQKRHDQAYAKTGIFSSGAAPPDSNTMDYKTYKGLQ